jgi:hypothetical protein
LVVLDCFVAGPLDVEPLYLEIPTASSALSATRQP